MFQNNGKNRTLNSLIHIIGSCLVGTNFGKAFYIYQDKLFSIGGFFDNLSYKLLLLVSKESLIITTLECYEDIIYLGCCKGSVTAYQKVKLKFLHLILLRMVIIIFPFYGQRKMLKGLKIHY